MNMNSFITKNLLVPTIMFLLFSWDAANAQENPRPSPVDVAVPVPAKKSTASSARLRGEGPREGDIPEVSEDVQEEIRGNERQIRRIAKQARDMAQQVEAMKSEAFTGFDDGTWHASIGSLDSAPFKFAASATSRTLFVPSKTPTPDLVREAEEDLRVMGRILEKAGQIRETKDGDEAMGIRVLLAERPRVLRQIHLQDSGAVFVYKMPYPLIAPPEPKTAVLEDTEDGDVWEDTKAELNGDAGRIDQRVVGVFNLDQSKAGLGGPALAYDESRVEQLKERVIKALKNASKMRHVAPHETIQVVLQGTASTGASQRTLLFARPGDGNILKLEKGAGAGKQDQSLLNSKGTVRTPKTVIDQTTVVNGDATKNAASSGTIVMRVKKSDAIAYANDPANFDKFKQNVSVIVY